MTRKEAIKYLKHLGLLLLTAIPLILVLDLFCFNNIKSSGLVIFLNVIIGLVWIILFEIIITKIKKSKQQKIEKRKKENLSNGK